MKNIFLSLIIVSIINICFAEANLKSPQDTFITFRSAMENVQLGDNNLIGVVFNCLEVSDDVPEFYKQTYLLSAAQRLQMKLEALDYSEDNIPSKTNDNNVEITLGFGKNIYTFILIKDKTGNWKFSSKTLNDPKLASFYKEQTAKLQKLTRKDMEGDTFVTELMSPAKTLLTFKLGMENIRGFSLKDALKTMNMDDISPLIYESHGKRIAVHLYRILEASDCFKISSLSTDPLTPSPQIILFKPEIGTIMLDVYTDPETGLKSWQFTPRSLAVTPMIYDSFAASSFKISSKNFSDDKIDKGNISIHFLIDDFIQEHAPFLEKDCLNMNLWKWLCFLVMLLIISIIILFLNWIIKPIIRLILRLGTNVRHIKLERAFAYPLLTWIIARIWFFVFLIIGISPTYFTAYVYFLKIVEIVTITWISLVITDTIGQIIMDKLARKFDMEQNLIIVMLIKIVKVIIFAIGLMSLVENFGISSIKIFAALGALGIALALAGKETIQNVFGTIMLMLEQPFKRGDYIVMNSVEGIIEYVGFRSTKVRTFYDSVITVPNAHFITNPLENKGVRRYRRYKTTLSIAYDTPPEKIAAFTAAIRKLVEKDPDIRKDVYRVRLYEMGPSSLDILVYIFFIAFSLDKEIELHEKFLLSVLRIAQKLNVEFAFPTQTIYTRPDKMPEHIPIESDKEAEEKGCKVAEEVLAKRKEEKNK